MVARARARAGRPGRAARPRTGGSRGARGRPRAAASGRGRPRAAAARARRRAVRAATHPKMTACHTMMLLRAPREERDAEAAASGERQPRRARRSPAPAWQREPARGAPHARVVERRRVDALRRVVAHALKVAHQAGLGARRHSSRRASRGGGAGASGCRRGATCATTRPHGARVSPASSRNAGAPAAARGTCVSSGEQGLGRRRAVGAAAARSGERIVSLGALSQTKARATRPLPPALPPRALPRAPRALGSNAPPRAGGRRPPDRPPARPARGRPQAPPAPAAGGSSTASSACTSTRPSRWM